MTFLEFLYTDVGTRVWMGSAAFAGGGLGIWWSYKICPDPNSASSRRKAECRKWQEDDADRAFLESGFEP